MGTNFYFMTTNRDLAHNFFADNHGTYMCDEEYELVENPYLGYQIHLNKLSMGWRPLFQKHKCFQTFEELEKFYLDHCDDLKIFDEYGKEFTWHEYKDRVLSHTAVEPKYYKWEYGVDPMDKIFGGDGTKKRLNLVECEKDKSEISTPFNHIKYFASEDAAMNKFCVNLPRYGDMKYWEDPKYNFDWTEGEFS